ncbi:hypothetical protein RJ640_002543 [Escallonia rubra]|uniref:Leucine-rich repeat-containing N-terminal plant-type domain-containing protein n=1 Tax=Escallonia rubra TaxID=112253 RepID=A0AA88U0P7_9ASTE|nr:hypothetical protein RJ640_002543 [Escallonia rubra]
MHVLVTKSQTSIEPKNKRLGRRVINGLNEPIKQPPPGFFIDCDIPSIVRKAHTKILTRQLQNLVQFLLANRVLRRNLITTGCVKMSDETEGVESKLEPPVSYPIRECAIKSSREEKKPGMFMPGILIKQNIVLSIEMSNCDKDDDVVEVSRKEVLKSWPAKSIELYIGLLDEEVKKNQRINNTFTQTTWNSMRTQLTAASGTIGCHKHMLKKVIGLEKLKKSFQNPPLDWNGDPCLPRQYSWTGVTCSEGSRVSAWPDRIVEQPIYVDCLAGYSYQVARPSSQSEQTV